MEKKEGETKIPAELFTGKAEDYARFRPSYPDQVLQFLKSRIPEGNILDVGAGTGIFTGLLSRGYKNVTALEPNKNMREKFMQNFPGIPCLEAAGESTPLPENSVDLITIAQAFHWLDEEKFKKEAGRILKNNGKAAVIWNNSIKDEFSAARDAISRKYCPSFRKGHAGKRTPEEGDDFLRHTYFRQVEVVSFANPFTMDLAAFQGNIRSRSYALTPDNREYPAYMKELETLFHKFACDGKVTEQLETQIFLGSF